MGLEKEIVEFISPAICLPAVGQGAIGIEARSSDQQLNEVFARLDHPESHIQIAAERAFLCELAADCHVPVAGLAVIKGKRIFFSGLVSDPKGQRVIKEEASCRLSGGYTNDLVDAADLGKEVADSIIKKGGRELLEMIP
jgi:hydroxymethylbilane synthase